MELMTKYPLAAFSLIAATAASACQASSHPTTPAQLGTPRPAAILESLLDEPGPIRVETVTSADWEVDREGLLNLDHPRAEAAQLEAGPEPIHIYFHALHHPAKGLFLVDSGVERRYRDAIDDVRVSWLIRSAMDLSTLKVHLPLGDYLDRQASPLRGVFLTHLHLDHVMGVPDVPANVPLYVGPGETEESDWTHLVTRGSGDEHLAGKTALRELSFTAEPHPSPGALLDVSGDGSLWAIWVPGHTAGSVAYLARTPTGPVLMTGDACHTRWGWEHQVEPGSFSRDRETSAESLQHLSQLVQRHPNISVRLGHQD
jgi:N-acyl homoserine lactone hydrolase